MTKQKIQELRHGYYACVSYVDALVGRLLARLRHAKIENDTVIVLWGDHGYHLGEQGLWTKANNFELSTRVPLILSVPGHQNAGRKCGRLVELIDVYPTLSDVCGLKTPVGVEGVSMKPLLVEPNRPWKLAIFSQYPRDRNSHRHRSHGDIMGYAVRTERYRYVEWQEWKTKDVVARELYDHTTDPRESRNIANQPAYEETMMRLAKILESGPEAVIPVQSE